MHADPDPKVSEMTAILKSKLETVAGKMTNKFLCCDLEKTKLVYNINMLSSKEIAEIVRILKVCMYGTTGIDDYLICKSFI